MILVNKLTQASNWNWYNLRTSRLFQGWKKSHFPYQLTCLSKIVVYLFFFFLTLSKFVRSYLHQSSYVAFYKPSAFGIGVLICLIHWSCLLRHSNGKNIAFANNESPHKPRFWIWKFLCGFTQVIPSFTGTPTSFTLFSLAPSSIASFVVSRILLFVAYKHGWWARVCICLCLTMSVSADTYVERNAIICTTVTDMLSATVNGFARSYWNDSWRRRHRRISSSL